MLDRTHKHLPDKDGCDVMCCGSLYFFFYLTAEQLPCQQSREAAGPQVHSGPPHQYHLLQNEGYTLSYIFICQCLFGFLLYLIHSTYPSDCHFVQCVTHIDIYSPEVLTLK